MLQSFFVVPETFLQNCVTQSEPIRSMEMKGGGYHAGRNAIRFIFLPFGIGTGADETAIRNILLCDCLPLQLLYRHAYNRFCSSCQEKLESYLCSGIGI